MSDPPRLHHRTPSYRQEIDVGLVCEVTLKSDKNGSQSNQSVDLTREAVNPQVASEPDLTLYKSRAGYDEIMKWYRGLLSQIDVLFEQKFVPTRFGQTHMLVCGRADAEPLILVQAVAGSAPLWRNQLSALSQHFRVYALDTVGQPGLSDQNPPSYLNDDYTLWLTDVMDALGIDQAHFVGISAGGWQVMRMSIDAPHRVKKTVLLSPIGVCRARFPARIWLSKMVKKSKDVDALQDDLTAKSVSSKSAGGSFGTFDRQLARAMALCTRHFRVDRSLGIYNAETGRTNKLQAVKVLKRFLFSEPKSVLRKLSDSTLIIFGEHEVLYNPYKVGAKLEKLGSAIQIEVMAGAGHAVVYDRPADANQRIVGFLKR